jgi:DNA-binding MarR family transcriptional regulator
VSSKEHAIREAITCLGELAAAFDRRRRTLAAQVDLTDQQWGVLEEIASDEFMPSLFAKQRERSAASVSKLLRQLADKGLIRAALSEADGRQRRYELTPTGRRKLATLNGLRQRAVEEIWAHFDAPRLVEFRKFGAELLCRMQNYADATPSVHAPAP